MTGAIVFPGKCWSLRAEFVEDICWLQGVVNAIDLLEPRRGLGDICQVRAEWNSLVVSGASTVSASQLQFLKSPTDWAGLVETAATKQSRKAKKPTKKLTFAEHSIEHPLILTRIQPSLRGNKLAGTIVRSS